MTDWLETCRAAVEDVKGVLAELPEGGARERVVGEGEGGDDTTAIDAAAEQAVVARLDSTGADFTLVSEELGIRAPRVETSGNVVVVDPIDGSINAKRGIPFFSLSIAVADGANREARWQMMMASFQGALAFVKGLGVVHSLSHALGRIKELKLHHGTLNAVILPHSLAMIGNAAPEKFARLREAMGLAANADLVQAISDLNARIGLPARLSDIGVTEAHWPATRDYAVSDLATGSNAVPFDGDKYAELFKRAL